MKPNGRIQNTKRHQGYAIQRVYANHCVTDISLLRRYYSRKQHTTSSIWAKTKHTRSKRNQTNKLEKKRVTSSKRDIGQHIQLDI